MKPKIPPSKVDRLIMEEASEWFVDFRVGDVDQQARARFDEWLRRSPEHIRAYLEMAKTYVELPALNLAGNTGVDALIAYARTGENVVPFDTVATVRSHEPQAMATEPGSRGRRGAGRISRLHRRVLAAASCAALFFAGGTVWWLSTRYPIYTTDIGERRSLTLADGSTVDLNARSRIRIEFSGTERRVELLDGQALFQVSKDKTRPFIVRSGDATVRAVGTQFDVYRKAGGTTVTVLEGRVAVYSATPSGTNPTGATGDRPEPADGTVRRASRTSMQTQAETTPHTNSLPSNPAGLVDPSGFAAVFLSAGEQVTVTPTQILPVPGRADIAATTAWTQRRLIFDGSRLSDVVQEFNRYNRRQLVIESAPLSDFHVSGVYSSTDPASLIRFLREQPGMKITEDDNEVRIAEK